MQKKQRPAWLILMCTLLMAWGSLLSAVTPLHALPAHDAVPATPAHPAATPIAATDEDHVLPCHDRAADAASDHRITSHATTSHDDCPDCAQSLCQQLCHWLTMPGHTAVVSVTPPPHVFAQWLMDNPRLGHPSLLLRPPQNT